MTELLTAAQMRAVEQAAIDSGEVTGLELMERAGRGVVEAIFEEWPELAATSHRAVVLCGPGNNGGDGFVVARLLKEWGWEVEVFLYGDPEKLPPDARVNYERWGELGRSPELLNNETWEKRSIPGRCDLVLDALFGTGLTRKIDLPLHRLTPMREVGQCHRVVSIDMPSGICSDSGKSLGYDLGVVHAELTVTFHAPKIGHYISTAPELADGAETSGVLSVVDIGLNQFGLLAALLSGKDEGSQGQKEASGWVLYPPNKDKKTERGFPEPSVFLVDGRALVWVCQKFDGHKYSHGHALILSGGPGKGGAARLAARGALRIGAGLVTVGCPPEALTETASRLDAVMCRPVGDADALSHVLQDERLNAVGLGPGLGVGEETRALVQTVLAANRATVLDADALTSFAEAPETLFSMLHDRCVLTPHGGEFCRLFPDIAEKLAAPATKGPAYSKVDATREAALRAGCVVLFKGPDTVIADPEGCSAINSAHYDRAAPWLATAGSGDVLAGFITGLLARGFGPMSAAETGAWLHVECALEFGPGLIAEDLPEMLPKVFRKLEL